MTTQAADQAVEERQGTQRRVESTKRQSEKLKSIVSKKKEKLVKCFNECHGLNEKGVI